MVLLYVCKLINDDEAVTHVDVPVGVFCDVLHEDCCAPGMKWECQLVFRSKLTMHTAYDRRDNTEPASVTALAISKLVVEKFISV